MALYDEGLQRAGNWVSNYIKNSMLPNLNPNPMMGVRPPTNMDMGSFGGPTPMNLPAPPTPAPTGQPKIPQGKSATSSQGNTPVIPPPPPLPNPQQQIQMGQLAAVPEYIAKFLVDVGRMALGMPEGGQPPLPSEPPTQPSHGYRIAEGGNPEVVNAEGAYFPFEKGQVTPLQNMKEGGDVEPVGMAAYEAAGRRMRGLPTMGTPPTGMGEYEESAARMRQPVLTTPVMGNRMLPYNERLSQYGSGGLSAYGSSPDMADVSRFKALGWKNPYESMRRYGDRKFEDIPLLPAKDGRDVFPFGEYDPTLAGEQMYGTPEPTEPKTFKEAALYQNILKPIEQFSESRRRAVGLPYTATPSLGIEPQISTVSGPQPPPYTGERPWRNKPAPVRTPLPGGPRVPMEYQDIPPYEPGWINYDEGIKYKMGPERFFSGGKEVPSGTTGAVSGDELARQRIMREATPNLRLPQISYYEAHPEERQAEYAMDLMRRLGGKEKFADIYKGLNEYGATGPEIEKNLAYAEHMRNLTPANLQIERERTQAGLQGIRERIAGDLKVAGISAEKNDLISKGINSILTKAASSYFPVDVTGEIGNLFRLGLAMGNVTQDQYNKLPPEYRATITRKQAIEFLTSKKAPITEANIQAVLQRGIQ